MSVLRLAFPATLAAACILAPTFALAHHPVGGAMPTGFADGFLSGLGHPILGLDHFVTLVGSALIAARARVIWPLAAFGTALLAGVIATVAGFAVPGIEALTGLTAVLMGLTLLIATRGASRLWLAALAAFGILHGIALGETVVGAEPTPIAAYLIGLAIVQTIVFAGLVWSFRRVFEASAAVRPMALRAAGAAIAVIGTGFVGLALLA